MSKTFEISENVSVTFFYGGEVRGHMVQINALGEGDSLNGSVEMTLEELKKFIKVYVEQLRDKYPGRDRNCPGCGATMFFQRKVGK